MDWSGRVYVNAPTAAASPHGIPLRDLYRYALAHGAAASPVPDSFIRGVADRSAALGLRQLQADGQVISGAEGWRLTDKGIMQAGQLVHNEQLWDHYRLYADELDLPAVQEDRQTEISALLPAAAMAKLESKLQEEGSA